MGTWIEIRCETALVEGYTRCWSRRNEWPGEMADDANAVSVVWFVTQWMYTWLEKLHIRIFDNAPWNRS